MQIDKNWSFDGVANNFGAHVREQLPFYDLLTETVAYMVCNYLPHDGLVYDIGCSTGNMFSVLSPILKERNANYIGIDSNEKMIEIARDTQFEIPNSMFVQADAVRYNYKKFDVGILFLTLMFVPTAQQTRLLRRLESQLRDGGCLILVDKYYAYSGYLSTVMKRLTLYWKIRNGAKSGDVIDKELSLAGIQRPVSEISYSMTPFFQLGEFGGWILQK